MLQTMEGLWWADDPAVFSTGEMDKWKWTVMIIQPEHVKEDLFEGSVRHVEKKKNSLVLSNLRFKSYHGGLSAKVMHIGPYPEEGPTIVRLHCFIKEKGYKLKGKRHEIYLSDPLGPAPEKMKTIIRQPIA